MDEYSDKENFTPSPTKVSYPRLPRPSPPRQIARKSEPYGSHTIYEKNALLRSPSNIGRRRSTRVGALTKSPPRSSHANKVKDIFDAPALGAWSGANLQNTADPDTSKSLHTSKKTTAITKVPGSPLTSESELERRLASPDYHAISHEDCHLRRGSEVHVALPLKRPDNFMISRQESTHVESSSEAWTGDEVFIPRSTRRQSRLNGNGGDSPSLNAACGHPTGIGPVRSPRSSRFRPNPIYTPCPELRRDVVDTPEDHRSSDADDEGDSDL